MATLLYTIFGITAGASLHCSVRREISPCTCAPHEIYANTIQVTCERMDNFTQVVDALQDRFSPNFNIWLKITHSHLQEDLGNLTFAEMNMNIKNLKLNHDNLTSLPVSTFTSLGRTEYLSLADNDFEEVPRDIFEHMPNVGTLDLARGRIKFITHNDFRNIQNLKHLVLAANQLEWIDNGTFPRKIVNLHIGRNKLTSLNGTLRELTELRTLFINHNNLVTLDNELPDTSHNLMMILAKSNRLTHLPQSFKNLPNLDILYLEKNELRSFDGLLAHATKLQRLYASENFVEYLAEDEFLEAENIDEVQMSHNRLTSLNNSLLNIRHLRVANFSSNLLTTFSLREVVGLRKLRILDLSHNRITTLTGRIGNMVEHGSLLYELRLEHNLMKSLDGALMGLNNLRILSLAHNHLITITPDDLIGMEELEILDLSNNRLETLTELSKTFLPSLETLNASYNQLTALEKDFHGLPVLCTADMSNNIISHIAVSLVSNTRCSNHGVPNKLKIYLQENPVLCDDNLPELVAAMEMQQARLLGIAHCIVPQQIMDPSIIMQPPMTLQKMLKPQSIAVAPNLLQPLQPPPSIVQILVPAPLIQEPIFINVTSTTTEAQPMEPVTPSTTTTTTTQAVPVAQPEETETAVENVAEPQKEETNETHQPQEEVPEEVEFHAVQQDEAVSSTTRQSVAAQDMIGNVIHEVSKELFSEYSPIVPEVLQPIERQQALSAEPETPPEDTQDDVDLQDDLTP